MIEKTCNCCNVTKPIKSFHKNGSRGHHNICSICRNNKRKGWSKDWENNPERIFKTYKRSALKRGIVFNLELQDFCHKDLSCTYCGTKLDRARYDRVNNDGDYSKENIVPCCHLCNFLKQDLSKNIFLEQVLKIYNYQKGKDNDK